MWTLVKPILYVCGLLLLAMSMLMSIVAGFAWIRTDPATSIFLSSAALTAAAGLMLTLLARNARFNLVARQLYLLTSASWLTVALAAALPLFFGNFELSFTDAVFEAVSGITTTGSTVLSGLEHLPASLLLWRSLLQWLGGLGVIGMAVSILPFLQVGGMRLFQTESSDWSDKSMPRIQNLARFLLATYMGLSLACAFAYWANGMNMFDAINHAMTTVSTGGYATDDRSMGKFDLNILWVGIVFMLLGATPFTMIIAFVRRPELSLLKNSQWLSLLGIVFTVSAMLGTWLWSQSYYPTFEAYTQATFNLVSIITTTGYAAADYTTWGHFSIVLFLLVMFIGGCSGSTSGGLKVFRFQLGYLFMRNQFRKLVHPQGVFVTQYNNKVVTDDIVLSAVAFTFLFFICLAVVTLMLGLLGLDLITAVSAAATALTNVGPGLGPIVGPAGNFASLPDTAKWLLSFAMILGRLELMTVMVLFAPVFWRD